MRTTGMSKEQLLRQLLLAQLAVFLMLIALLWFDSNIDFERIAPRPTSLFAGHMQDLLESLMALIMLLLNMRLVTNLLGRIRYLEGLLPVCSFCKKIKVGDDWVPVDVYLQQHSEAVISHGLCDDCYRQHYGEVAAARL